MFICHHCLLLIHIQESHHACFFAMLITVWIFVGVFCFVLFSPCFFIALALEKRSLFHSLSYNNSLLLSHPVQCFGSPTFHHYCMLMLVDTHTHKKSEQLRSYSHLILLCCWRNFFRADTDSASFVTKTTPRCFAALSEPHWLQCMSPNAYQNEMV